jgi:glutathione synthase/RimK-type ligase-like ATP-grasp enzyme
VILVCGGLADSVTELVCARLEDCGYDYRLLDLGLYPAGYEVAWRSQDTGSSGYIAGPGWRLDLDDVTGVFVRYLGLTGRAPSPAAYAGAESALFSEYDTGLMLLLEDLPCTVVNRTGGGLSNNSKPLQALLVRECGLKTPPTLVTDDPGAARDFYAEFRGDVIYKSLSGIRSIVRRLQPAQLERLALLRHGPAQFQAYIPGNNVRVHTVGAEIFATRVLSEAVDYRYAGQDGLSVKMASALLPDGVADSCLRMARELDLELTGIDLKETPDGDYYCFEVNPSPAFLYFERFTGQPISRALADLLRSDTRQYHFEGEHACPTPARPPKTTSPSSPSSRPPTARR